MNYFKDVIARDKYGKSIIVRCGIYNGEKVLVGQDVMSSISVTTPTFKYFGNDNLISIHGNEFNNDYYGSKKARGTLYFVKEDATLPKKRRERDVILSIMHTIFSTISSDDDIMECVGTYKDEDTNELAESSSDKSGNDYLDSVNNGKQIDKEGHIKFFEEEGCFFFNLKDIAIGLGIVQYDQNGHKSVYYERLYGIMAQLDVVSDKHKDHKNCLPEYISEENYYLLAQYVDTKSAKEFNYEMVKNIIPSAHKKKAYLKEDDIEATLSDPDFLIKLAKRMKSFDERRKVAENKLQESEKQVEQLKQKLGRLEDYISSIKTSLSNYSAEEIKEDIAS